MANKKLLLEAMNAMEETHERHLEERQIQRKTIGKILKDMRVAAGVSGANLAKAIGCSRMLIHQYEVGDYAPSNERAQDIINALTKGKK